jgi:UDP-glucose-4-epimerase GalE
MNRVLVTGGAGYIGSYTAKVLASEGIEPIVLDNLTTGHRRSIQWGPFVHGDVGDRDLVRRVLRDWRVDGVVHFAASAYVGESVRKPRPYFRNNVANTLTLVEEMLDAGVSRIVFSSTCATYGIPATLPIVEDHLQWPVNPYGDSKLFVERVLRAFGDAYGLSWVALRYFNAAGADPEGALGEDHDPETHLIPLVIQAALGQRPRIDVFGTDYPTPDGTAIRDYIHVSDLADAHVRALAYLREGGRSVALNLGSGRGYSVRDVIAAVEHVGGRPVPVRETLRRPGDPPALVADSKRARELLGWQPRYADLKQIVRTAWNWHAGAGRTVPRVQFVPAATAAGN